MRVAIVTASDKKFIPGVIALYNSLQSNAETQYDFILFAHGEEEDFSELSIEKIFNPDPIDSPTSSKWPEKLPAMYSRIMIPRLLKGYDRVLWLDADTIVLREIHSLITMDMGDFPIAASSPGAAFQPENLRFMPFQLENPEKFPELRRTKSIQAGVVLFDIKNWQNNNLDNTIDNLLVSDIKFKFVVQGLMGLALKGNFIELPYKWNCPVSWTSRYGIDDIHILHYVGGRGRNPWEYDMPHKNIWESYRGVKI